METIESFLELPLQVEYSVSGDYRPATQIDPAEEPELELTSVKLGNTEIMHELPEKDLANLRDEAWDDASDRKADDEAARGDWLYEQHKDERRGI